MTGGGGELPAWVHATGTLLCPYCAYLNRHASLGKDAPEHAPREGDWSICSKCRGVAIFVVGPFGHAVRKPTAAEFAEANGDPDLRRALAALAESFTVAEAVELIRPGATSASEWGGAG